MQVVPESSAEIQGFYKLALDSDHFGLNKFGDINEDNYVLVASNIVRIVHELHTSHEEGSERECNTNQALVMNHTNMPGSSIPTIHHDMSVLEAQHNAIDSLNAPTEPSTNVDMQSTPAGQAETKDNNKNASPSVSQSSQPKSIERVLVGHILSAFQLFLLESFAESLSTSVSGIEQTEYVLSNIFGHYTDTPTSLILRLCRDWALSALDQEKASVRARIESDSDRNTAEEAWRGCRQWLCKVYNSASCGQNKTRLVEVEVEVEVERYMCICICAAGGVLVSWCYLVYSSLPAADAYSTEKGSALELLFAWLVMPLDSLHSRGNISCSRTE